MRVYSIGRKILGEVFDAERVARRYDFPVCVLRFHINWKFCYEHIGNGSEA